MTWGFVQVRALELSFHGYSVFSFPVTPLHEVKLQNAQGRCGTAAL
jgi:hypothetical protein